MATKEVGLAARLKFNGEAAIAGMNKAGGAFARLDAKTKQLKAGLSGMKAGFAGMATTGLWAAGGVGFAVKKFADFDGQMATVKAVLGESRRKDFPMLTAEAKKLGATTSFTASQSAAAMEELARAGMEPKQIMASIGPVLAAAAADNMDLATSAKVAVSSLAQFGMPASETARVMDAMAYVSRNTKSNIVALANGMTYVGLKAKSMKIPFEDTVASLGALNDAGLDGTLAGTAMNNMLTKMAANAKRGYIAIKGFKTEIVKNADGTLNLNKTMQGTVAQLAKIENVEKRAQVATKLFGIRGEKAVLAFGALKKEKIATLFDNMREKAKGTALEMQRMQLDSLKGKFTLLSSAVDGVVNALGAAASGTIGGGIAGITDSLGSAAKAFQYFATNSKEVGKDTPIQIAGVSKEMMSFVRGILRGIEDVKAVFGGMFAMLKSIGGLFSSAESTGSSSMSRLTTGAIGVSIAMAPIGIAIKGATKLFVPFAKAGVGAMKTVMGATKPLIGLLGSGVGKVLNKFAPAKALPGKVGLLSKAIGGLDKMTANPVRVVNFDEMGVAGGIAGKTAAGGQMAGGLAGARQGLFSFMSRFGKVGAFFNSGVGKLASTVGGKAGLVGILAGVGAAGYAFGTWLDKKFGISEKLGNALHNLFNSAQIAAEKEKTKRHNLGVVTSHAERMAQQWAKFSKGGKGMKQIEIYGAGGKKEKVDLTRSMATKRLTEYMKQQGNTDAEVKKTLASLKDVLASIPEKIVVDNKLTVDGKVLASSTGKKKVEGAERGNKKTGRRAAAVGAAP